MTIRSARTAVVVLLGLMMSANSAGAQWVLLGVDDCFGEDTACSAGATPDPLLCNGDTSGTTAVCWDDVTYSNGVGCSSSAWCTYKSVLAPMCTGGSNLGYVYECGAPANTPTETPLPTATPTASPTLAAGCSHVPEPGCRTAQKSLLLIKTTGGASDRQIFKWVKGAALMPTELADPTSTTPYRVCMYSGNTNDFLEAFSVPVGGSNWSTVSDKGYIYKESTGLNGGLTKLLLKGSTTPGRSKVLVKGKGTNLPDPILTSLPLPVTVQVVNPDTGVCIEAVFDSSALLKNEDSLFKAKLQQ